MRPSAVADPRAFRKNEVESDEQAKDGYGNRRSDMRPRLGLYAGLLLELGGTEAASLEAILGARFEA
jgi:hypothetical protein